MPTGATKCIGLIVYISSVQNLFQGPVSPGDVFFGHFYIDIGDFEVQIRSFYVFYIIFGLKHKSELFFINKQ